MAVVVRWARVDGLVIREDGLSTAERHRLGSYRELVDRQRFLGARLLLRQVVALQVGCAPGEVEVVQECRRCGGAHGRPVVVVRGGGGPEVSVAHAGDLAVVAVAGAPVGVDIEPSAVPNDLRTWVRREAVLKATGHGLDVDPRLLELGRPEDPPKLVAWAGPGRRPSLRLRDLDPPAGYVGAVARMGWRALRVDAGGASLSPAD